MSAKVEAAVEGYRLSVEYRRYIKKKWEGRMDKVRKLDAFHRTSVAWENDDTRGEWLCRRAADVLLASIRGDQPYLDQFATQLFAKCRNRKFMRALRAIDAALEMK